jgi:hypothetical protein
MTKPRIRGFGKYIDSSFLRKGDKNRSYRLFIRIPPGVAHHKLFPFRDGERVLVRIHNGRLIISRMDEDDE